MDSHSSMFLACVLAQEPEQQIVALTRPCAVATVEQARSDGHTIRATVVLDTSDVPAAAIVRCGPVGRGRTTASIRGQCTHGLCDGHIVPAASQTAISGDRAIIPRMHVQDR